MNRQPTVLIILGATGDLTKKKLLPALSHLVDSGAAPAKFDVTGFSRRQWTNRGFRDYAASAFPGISAKLLPALSFVEGTFEDARGYKRLADHLAAIDKAWGTKASRIFFLAVPPVSYRQILEHLGRSGLIGRRGRTNRTRLIIEKPFGSDSKSGAVLDRLLRRHVAENQIYRIDHYLAKEALQNIPMLRFGTTIFKSIWNNSHIARVDIRTLESLGAEDRGPFYDAVGTLRDVGQNHLLEMLALIAMDKPRAFSGEPMRQARAAVLKTLIPPKPDAIKAETFRAQYEGFRALPGVSPGSTTETYFRTVSYLRHSSWRGVPFILEAGKRLDTPRKEIVVTFKPAALQPSHHAPERLIIRFEPEEELVLEFAAKSPGLGYELRQQSMKLPLRSGAERTQYSEEYEKLLLDCIDGDQTLFVSKEELKPMWRFVDAIRQGWNTGAVPLKKYQPGTATILETSEKFFRKF